MKHQFPGVDRIAQFRIHKVFYQPGFFVYGGQRIIYFVSDTGGQFADGGQLGGVFQLHPGPVRFHFQISQLFGAISNDEESNSQHPDQNQDNLEPVA